jgi:hypothetical protein
MRLTRWDRGVPAAAWLFLAFALVWFSISWWNPATTGLVGMVPNLLLVLAIGVVLGIRICWATAFVLTGIWVTLAGMALSLSLLGPSHGVYAGEGIAFLGAAVPFGALVALHPRWNARWAETPAG